MISKKEVEHVARLARMDISPEEIESLRKDLSSVLDYIESLKKADIVKQDATSHLGEAVNVFRPDRAVKESEEVVGKLVQSAPSKKDGYIKVRPVLQ